MLRKERAPASAPMRMRVAYRAGRRETRDRKRLAQWRGREVEVPGRYGAPAGEQESELER
jgi:hypothetical protein